MAVRLVLALLDDEAIARRHTRYLFNDRADATARLSMDMKEYYGALAGLGVSEAELLVKAKQSSKMQKPNTA